MNQERLLKILIAVRVSEKSSLISGQYIFKVIPGATKSEIKSTVENQFNVVVKTVHISNIKGKAIRFRKVRGRRKNWKKAYVTLVPGNEINIVTGE
ncbi:50S ribosomal protein L23 [Coxiella endosymbiont of Rhipicephalus microplus]|uniref:50S ribosomal protein L23 n=1 Tax=Coxiella endosymbiont of Rhipicephalus microplus TaxID=1656186 RepID=UPI000C80932C|nr:50S ribosomal protein L23 [Coxiella endosymbiont of Rhipicephalus microplus]PMB54827.1 LSU ribosomal protein L23p (L23Ae) [Coxiella-like endosymbiont]